jgi:hypothetical protein
MEGVSRAPEVGEISIRFGLTDLTQESTPRARKMMIIEILGFTFKDYNPAHTSCQCKSPFPLTIPGMRVKLSTLQEETLSIESVFIEWVVLRDAYHSRIL